MGNTVTCVDVKQDVVDRLNAGHVHIYEPGLAPMVQRSHADGRLLFTTDLSKGLEGAEVAFICVGTPPDEDGSADLHYVEQVADEIGKFMKNDLIVVDKSTVPVGTADRVTAIIQKNLDVRGLKLNFEVVSNPEFLKEGAAIQDFMKPDRVVVGTSYEKAADVMRELYAPFARTRSKLIVMGVHSAEMTKYAANCMLATKISFINEIANICEKVGADVRDVRTGIGSDSRIGYQFIYPGVGYGGSCFPKDVKALIRTALDAGLKAPLLQAVEDVNKHQKQHMAEIIENYFAPQGGVKGKTLALWGLAFKANTDDMREAPGLVLIDKLLKAGCQVRAYDPAAMDECKRRIGDVIYYARDMYDAVLDADVLMLITEWKEFRLPSWAVVKKTMNQQIVLDGRNIYDKKEMEELGFIYSCIGK